MPRKSSEVPDIGLRPPPSRASHTSHASNGNEPPLTIEEARTEAINGVLQLGQYACIAFGDFPDAGAIGMHGPPLTKEVVDLAAKNKAVASKVDLLIEVGPYAGIIAAGIPFIVQILCNHKLLKAEQWANAGIVTPESLEYQMKTTLMKQQMEAMNRQKEAEADLLRMQEEMTQSMRDAEYEDEKAENG